MARLQQTPGRKRMSSPCRTHSPRRTHAVRAGTCGPWNCPASPR
ncbi:hypothetical protein SHJG_7326 [Streptomyces hygroscopicus subsp. jinggangensis 5008]|nr:hypothetical protein SHJG_7326 [Streptomyces hygroscopicus subsp. jinggangensis 5008]AGF66748.1 hypothetical protein SHJGH_7086 [Streptomyces hygroscopicus subsp. jinggangensis TL01]